MEIKQFRESTGKTQAQSAEELGITVVYFSDLERGVFKPSPVLSIKIEEWSKGKVNRTELRPDLWG